MESGLSSSDLWLGIVASLLAVPVTFITLYLRSLREHQLTKHREVEHRLERLEEALPRQTVMIADMERDFATKEEWLRETMHTRHRLEKMIEAVVRIETTLFDQPTSSVTRLNHLDSASRDSGRSVVGSGSAKNAGGS